MARDSIPAEELDRIFNVLANRECRLVLNYFRRHSTEHATVSDLVKFVCEESSISKYNEDVEAVLYHSVLPKMAEAEVIDYDSKSESVRYQGHRAIEPYLNQIVE